MDSIHARRKFCEQRLAMVLSQLNEAICDLHKSGLDVDISTVIKHTQRGPMLQVNAYTYKLYGAPPVLRVVD